MCGIGGIVYWDKRPVDASVLQAMADRMKRRGPDDSGIQTGPGWGLVHRRLSIIDLTQSARQPLSNEDGKIWLIFNGEIYNFSSLRRQLVKAGHRFVSKTDCEVILHGYEEWGFSQLLEKINGMFAFALWDSESGQLMLARDPFGEKPLFIWHDESRVFFASSLQAIMKTRENWELDPESITEYLEYSFVPEDSCILRGVKKLSPGYAFVFNQNGSELKPFWRLEPTPKIDDEDEGIERKVRDLLIESVGRRLTSDVPLGAFLSGGVDSSLVCWAMCEQLDDVNTYTISMGDHAWDEATHAREIAGYLGTNHHVLEANPKDLSLLPTIAEAYSEPFGDSSALPSLLVAKLAREMVSVVLTGDGGDELFAGYPRVWKAHIAEWWRRRIGPFGGKVLTGLGGSMLHMPSAVGSLGHRARTFGIFIHQGAPAQYISNPSLQSYYQLNALGETTRSVLQNYDPLAKSLSRFDLVSAEDEAERMMWHDVNFRLASDYLTKVDSATMYYSLEARCPFLDISLWQYAARLTTGQRMPGNKRKGLLSNLAAALLPKSVILRGKQGFGIPFHEWLRESWFGFWQDLFESSACHRLGLLNDLGVKKMLQAHRNGKNHSVSLWNMAMLELWLRANRF